MPPASCSPTTTLQAIRPPSASDIKQTDAIGKACKLMDIGLVDHLILSPDSYYSFADEAEAEYNF